MPQKYEQRIQAERFIHNDLANCSFTFAKRMKEQIDSGKTTGLYPDMMASLIFSSFENEAKVNFVGWSVLENGWPERASIVAKIDLLLVVLKINLDWDKRPLQTIKKLNRFRNILAHGKPEIVDETKIVDGEPEIWDLLRGQWTSMVNRKFVELCSEDVKKLWETLLNAAGIDSGHTLTHGSDTLTAIVEPDE